MASMALATLLSAALAGGNAAAWRWAIADGSLGPTLCAIAGVALVLLAAPALLLLAMGRRQER